MYPLTKTGYFIIIIIIIIIIVVITYICTNMYLSENKCIILCQSLGFDECDLAAI